ncbi:MAG: hypothetical protein HY079_00885, partial [Elusimicrobia bacterium]|nr:hypothetical protein [Elusimicrobiota bacterium]
MLALLLRRRGRSFANTLGAYTPYEWVRNSAFGAAGFALLYGLHYGFFRLLTYISGIELIGVLLLWKLSAMMFLMTLSMVTVSSLLTSLTT